jgi:hypothetical protein
MALWASVTPKIMKNGFQSYEIGNLIFYEQLSARACACVYVCSMYVCVRVWCLCMCAVCMYVCVRA